MGVFVVVEGLCIIVGEQIFVDNFSFVIQFGEVLVLIGELGFGKIIIVLVLMGYVCCGCEIVLGSICIGDIDVLYLLYVE